ncbi:MAG: peroxiredoxin [Pseudomonadota bacterium]
MADEEVKIFSMVGYEAPKFTGSALMPDNNFNNDFHLEEYFKDSYGVIFFYSLNFTYVCPTELIALNNRLQEFTNRNTKIVAVSTDSQFSHLSWKKIPHKYGGIGNVQFPLVSDLTHSITKNYGVIVNDAIALRGTFFLDKAGVVRYQQVNDLSLGRNIDEIIRTIDAFQYHEATGEVCPAGWQIGDDGVVPDEKGVGNYLAKNASNL